MSTRLIVMQGPELIADVPDYNGPAPVVGTYLFHPPLWPHDDGRDPWDGGIAGCVKAVTLAIYDRPQNGESYFTGRAVNIIEVAI